MDDDLARRVGRIITRYSMLSAGDRVGVAISGGADSVVLLHLLHGLCAELGVGLKVLHVNHALRGSESEDDELFVRELAGSFGLECLVERREVAGGNLEQETRRARRSFFRRCLQENGFRRIALGHTRSDQAETVLLRVFRGSGLAGLAGMQMMTAEGLMRPLLTSSREEIRQWAQAQGIRWREDSSNANLGFARNRLRKEVIPNLAAHFNSNLEGVLAATAELAQDEENYWSEQIPTIYGQITKRTELGSILQTDSLAALHVAVRRRVIRWALEVLRGDLRGIDLEHVDAILAICVSAHGHDRVMVPGADALRSFDRLLLRRPEESQADSRHYCIELHYDEPCELPFRAGWICVSRVTPGAANCASFKEDRELPAEIAYLTGGILNQESSGFVPLYMRNWEPGDQLHRPGHRQPEKIKTLFQEGRVLLWERRHWPVLIAGDEIMWVRQFGSGAKFAASVKGTEQIRITYRQSGG